MESIEPGDRRTEAHVFGRWVAACTAGELLGFGAAALWAWLAFSLVGPDPASLGARLLALGLMVMAGLFEGAVLGGFQWTALKQRFPRLRARSWLFATIAVAGLGWLLGMIPSTFLVSGASGGGAQEPPFALVLAGAAGFGAIAGSAFGFAQWLVLRHHAAGARRWIWANALGWAIGLPWSYLAGGAVDVTRSVPLAILIGALAGALMGASVALVTGLALRRIEPAARA